MACSGFVCYDVALWNFSILFILSSMYVYDITIRAPLFDDWLEFPGIFLILFFSKNFLLKNL
jgi:hypothetical protein